MNLRNHHFLNKKASVVPANLGKYIRNLTESGKVAPDMSNLKIYTDAEKLQRERELWDKDGSGSFLFDWLHAATKFLPENWNVKGTIDNKLYNLKKIMQEKDTQAGSWFAGKDPNSWRGKVFSVKREDPFGTVTNDDVVEELYTKGNRRPSILAPISNTMQLATPLLASAYLTEKLLMPTNNQQQPQNEQQNYQQNNIPFQRTASYIDTNSSDTQNLVWDSLEKQATLNKIAELEDDLEKMAAYADSLKQENHLLHKVASEEKLAHEQTLEKFATLKKDYVNKKAESEEFRLRTVARERSKYAVKLAEEMLEQSMIKQADFDKQVDLLMSCDETTFNLYANMVKQSSVSDEGLESLSLLGEYSNMNSNSSFDHSSKGLNKAGQTIGEAARYLLDKQ